MKNKKQRRHPYLINWIVLGLIILMIIALSLTLFYYITNQNLIAAHESIETEATQTTSNDLSEFSLPGFTKE